MHYYSSPLPERCPSCGAFHLHCPYCSHPVDLRPMDGDPIPTVHFCTRCGGGRQIQLTPVKAAVPAPAGAGRSAPSPATSPPPGDPLAQQRQALARAYQASPAAAPEPEETDLDRWKEALCTVAHPVADKLFDHTESVRFLNREVVVVVPPELIGPAHFKDRLVFSGRFLVAYLSHELERPVTLVPTHQLKPCPPDMARLTLAEWSGRGLQLQHVNPTSVGSIYRRVFGVSPRKKVQTCLYSPREMRILGLLDMEAQP